jgi:L-lactate dehydrogenase complex protein LldG
MDYIVALCKQKDVKSAVRSDEEVFQSLPVDQSLSPAGARVTVMAKSLGFSQQDVRKTAATAGLGLTGVDFAIAETATLVAIPHKGLSRLVSLLPPIHLAIVRPQDVIERLEDVFLLRRLAYKNGGDVPNYMNFITGPSRTGDIEQTIIVGAHGPKETHMLLLG